MITFSIGGGGELTVRATCPSCIPQESDIVAEIALSPGDTTEYEIRPETEQQCPSCKQSFRVGTYRE